MHSKRYTFNCHADRRSFSQSGNPHILYWHPHNHSKYTLGCGGMYMYIGQVDEFLMGAMIIYNPQLPPESLLLAW